MEAQIWTIRHGSRTFKVNRSPNHGEILQQHPALGAKISGPDKWTQCGPSLQLVKQFSAWTRAPQLSLRSPVTCEMPARFFKRSTLLPASELVQGDHLNPNGNRTKVIRRQTAARSATGPATPSPQESPNPSPGFAAALLEPIEPSLPKDPHPSLINEDFQPTMPEGRIFTIWDLTSLWIGLVVAVPTYYLAGSLVEMGMSCWQGVVTVFCGNLVVLLPMILNGEVEHKHEQEHWRAISLL
jgi:hypothetical protein